MTLLNTTETTTTNPPNASTIHPHPEHDRPNLTHDALTESVRIAVGTPTAQPRNGQQQLSADITRTFTTWQRNPHHEPGRFQVAGQAPTGSGKGLAYLTPAMVAAVAGRRTLISTESLALQAQLVNKDAPAVAQAVHKLTGVHITTAILKGFSNYACLYAAIDSAYRTLGEPVPMERDMPTTPDELAALANRVTNHTTRTRTEHARDAAATTAWALNLPTKNPTSTGETKDAPTGGTALRDITVASNECIGDSCPLIDLCYPKAARRQAADADIVITNHTLVGIQAATGAPIVVGSKALGEFTHIVVDEAHTLPAKVRDAGARTISSKVLYDAARFIGNAFDPETAERHAAAANRLGPLIDTALRPLVSRTREDKVAVQGNPLGNLADDIDGWINQVTADLPDPSHVSADLALKVRRVKSRMNDLSTALDNLVTDTPGVARWADLVVPRTKPGTRPGTTTREYPELACSPIHVAGLLRANVWTSPFYLDDGTVDRDGARYPLAVTCVSATMPVAFSRDAGLQTPLTRHPSPFEDAYTRSSIYVPSAIAPPDIEALARPGTATSKKPVFDSSRHTDWATPKVVDLVHANNGSALVLAATATSARRYADELRDQLGEQFPIWSQWDFGTTEAATAAWRADTTSVLVGTRSLMTGVDAAGETCSLVVIDRVPRSPQNPVDEARVDLLVADGASLWGARSAVYGGDAACLLDQACGRLIRSMNDTGMVAVLDPRLHRHTAGRPKRSAFANTAAAQNLYAPVLKRFGVKIADHDTALEWLTRRTR